MLNNAKYMLQLGFSNVNATYANVYQLCKT